MNTRTISLDLFSITFPKGIDLILARPSVPATHLSSSSRDHTPSGPDIGRHTIRLVLRISDSQLGGVGYICISSEFHLPSATTLSLLDQGPLFDASKCGSGAYYNTRISQHLLIQDIMEAKHARL
jgi:hypothetical protein